jgi:iron complex outermembrane receptor protein
VAGYIYIEPQVAYEVPPGIMATRIAIGPIPGLLRANFQYRPLFLEGLILDAKVERTSSRYARYDSISLPSVTSFDVGARYNKSLFNKPATWRLQLYNIGNASYLTPQASGQLQSYDARHFELSLAFDL